MKKLFDFFRRLLRLKMEPKPPVHEPTVMYRHEMINRVKRTDRDHFSRSYKKRKTWQNQN